MAVPGAETAAAAAGGVTPFDAAAIVITLAAFLGYINHRFIKLPDTIGLTVTGAIASLIIVGIDHMIPGVHISDPVTDFISGIDFYEALIEGMLSFLLFAGALHVNLEPLLQRRWAILVMSTLGVIISTVIIGLGFYALMHEAGIGIPLAWCLVFGALISPTDPVAVLGTLKSAKVPPTLEAKVAGESLFNDGVGVVIFSILLAAAIGEEAFSVGHALELFALEAGGGVVLGLILGGIGFIALRSIDAYELEVMITLALVMGGYALAHQLHIAGPVAMAVAGLWIGNHGTRLAMSAKTREHLHSFWTLVDEILNSVLFLLIGLEVVQISGEPAFIMIGLLGIILMLIGRTAAVAPPIYILGKVTKLDRGAMPIMIWGGLRGGISIALALSLPPGEIRDAILTVTYIIVVFSVVVQGSTVGRLAQRLTGDPELQLEEHAKLPPR